MLWVDGREEREYGWRTSFLDSVMLASAEG